MLDTKLLNKLTNKWQNNRLEMTAVSDGDHLIDIVTLAGEMLKQITEPHEFCTADKAGNVISHLHHFTELAQDLHVLVVIAAELLDVMCPETVPVVNV